MRQRLPRSVVERLGLLQPALRGPYSACARAIPFDGAHGRLKALGHDPEGHRVVD